MKDGPVVILLLGMHECWQTLNFVLAIKRFIAYQL